MTWSYDVRGGSLLSPASDSLSSLDSKLRHSAYAHLRVARAQCVYGFIFSRIFGHVWMPYYRRRAYKRSRGSRDKYSVHQKAFSFTAGRVQQRRRYRPSRPSHSRRQHGHPWHLPLRYHPPVIFTLHLKFIFHMKFVGPVDVRSLNTPSGAVILTRPFLSEFRLIKK